MARSRPEGQGRWTTIPLAGALARFAFVVWAKCRHLPSVVVRDSEALTCGSRSAVSRHNTLVRPLPPVTLDFQGAGRSLYGQVFFAMPPSSSLFVLAESGGHTRMLGASAPTVRASAESPTVASRLIRTSASS